MDVGFCMAVVLPLEQTLLLLIGYYAAKVHRMDLEDQVFTLNISFYKRECQDSG